MDILYNKNSEILLELAKGWRSNYDDELPNIKSNFFNNVGELKSIQGFDKIVQDEIRSYASNNGLDFEWLNQLLISMAIDSENGQVLDYIENNFTPKQLYDVIYVGLVHPWKDVRWQIIELVSRSNIESKATLIYNSLKKESDSYVLRVGLNLLEGIDKNLSYIIASENLESEDSYLRVLAAEIHENLNSE